MQNSNKKATWMFTLFGIIFFGPVLAAVVVYFLRPDWLEQTTNKGQLITPPRDFYNVQLHAPNGQLIKQHGTDERKWLFIYMTTQPCNTDCKRSIYKMQQTYKALFENKRKRVARILITFERSNDSQFYNWLNKHYHGTQFYIMRKTDFIKLTQGLPSQQQVLTKGAYYLVDPNGNLMMSYAQDIKPKNLLSDIRKLLRNSQIG